MAGEKGYISVRDWRRFQHYDPAKRTPPWIKNYTELLHDHAYLGLTQTQRAVLHGLWLEYASSGCKVPESTASLSRRLGLRVTKRTLEALNHAGFIDFVASAALADGYHGASPETEVETEKETTTLGDEEDHDFAHNVSEDEDVPGDDLGHELRELGLTPSQVVLALHEDRDRVRRVIAHAKTNGDNPAALAWTMLRDKLEPSQDNGRRRYTGCRLVRGTHGVSHEHNPLGTDKPPNGWPHPRPTADEIRAAQEAA